MSKKFDGAEKGWMTVDVRDGLIVMKLKDATELYDRITASSANCSSSPEGVRLYTGSYAELFNILCVAPGGGPVSKDLSRGWMGFDQADADDS